MITECGMQTTKTNARRIFDALCGNYTPRVRGGCRRARRAGLERTVKRKTGEQNHFCERERKSEHKPGVQFYRGLNLLKFIIFMIDTLRSIAQKKRTAAFATARSCRWFLLFGEAGNIDSVNLAAALVDRIYTHRAVISRPIRVKITPRRYRIRRVRIKSPYLKRFFRFQII